MFCTRRRALVYGGRTALGLSLLPLGSCSTPRTERQEAPEAEPVSPPAVAAVLEEQIPPLLAAGRVPGLSMALIENGRVAWSRGFGVLHEGAGVPVDTDTLFEAGSISKTVFAYAVMQLSDRGLLDLDKPLTSYISERWLPGDPRLDRITARHVLSHTSGFQNWRSTEDPLRLHFAPGAQYLYSGEGYSYLQLVVAHVTGRVSTEACETLYDGIRVCETEIDAYMKANLLRPFGMTSSGYVWDDALAGRTAGPHDLQGRPLDRPRATPILAARFGAAGGLSTTPTEYARFLIEVLDPKPGDAFRLINVTRDEMIRPQVMVSDSASWALGWQVLHRANGDLLSHGGDNPGFKAFMVASAARKSGYIMMTNGDNGSEVMGKLASGDTPLNAFVTG
ncbi:MAG TPA: serine hydrolase domain-containing protein [Vicinamibacterales bacterium]